MKEEDWLGLLYGDFTGLAPFMDGSVHPARDGANKVALLGILMHTFARFPSGSNPPDPDTLQRVLNGLIRHGLPSARASWASPTSSPTSSTTPSEPCARRRRPLPRRRR